MSRPHPSDEPAGGRSAGGTPPALLRAGGPATVRSRPRLDRRRREEGDGRAEPNAFSSCWIAYSGDPREAHFLRKAGEILMAGRGEAKLPEVEPLTAARVRASAVAGECGALADWCRNADLAGDLLAMEEPAAAYLYHLLERAGWRLRAIHDEIRSAFTDLHGKARVWAEGYREPATAGGEALSRLLLLLDLRQAFHRARRLVSTPQVGNTAGVPDHPDVALVRLLDRAEEGLRRAVEELDAAYALAEGLEEP